MTVTDVREEAKIDLHYWLDRNFFDLWSTDAERGAAVEWIEAWIDRQEPAEDANTKRLAWLGCLDWRRTVDSAKRGFGPAQRTYS